MPTDSITKAIETLELKSFSILYVEDEEIVRCTFISIISRRYPHARINTAENGAEGLELFKAFLHDMVITDHNMPIMTGAQMATEIRLIRPETIIIFISGGIDPDAMQYLTRQGVVHFLEKPHSYKELFILIERCMEELPGMSPPPAGLKQN
jgi:YesN/AraC family two-component response regulator